MLQLSKIVLSPAFIAVALLMLQKHKANNSRTKIHSSSGSVRLSAAEENKSMHGVAEDSQSFVWIYKEVEESSCRMWRGF
jgi:hypothetical protein